MDNPLGSAPPSDDQSMMSQNPRGFDVGVQPSGQPSAQPQPGAAPAPPDPATAAASADVQHHYGIGRAFKSLLGGPSSQTDPRTGQEVPVKKDHGALMRGILAGALLGSAAGSETPNNPYSGFARGGAAALQDGRNQEQMKQKQAQQEFENQMKSRRADTEDTLLKAQVAHYNAQTVRENQLIQGTDHEMHEKTANYGKTQLQPFIDAGVPYQFKDMSESDMHDLFKNNPNANNMLWEPTGTKITTDANGKPNVEMTYSAVDPKGKVKVTDAQVKQWKEDGLDQVYGKDAFDILKKDKELDINRYMTISQKGQELGNKALLKKRQDFELEKDKSQIDLSKAQVAHLKAESGKLYADIADKKAFDTGWGTLMSGGDLSKLSPKQRTAVTKGLTEIQGTIERQIHELPKDESGNPRDQARAKELYDTWDTYQGIQNKVYGVQKKEAANPAPAGNDKVRAERNGKVLYIPKKEVDEFLRDNPDAKAGGDVSISREDELKSKVDNMIRDDKTVRFDEGLPSVEDFPMLDGTDQQLLTDGSGNYIVRDPEFKNPKWKPVKLGKSSQVAAK